MGLAIGTNEKWEAATTASIVVSKVAAIEITQVNDMDKFH